MQCYSDEWGYDYVDGGVDHRLTDLQEGVKNLFRRVCKVLPLAASFFLELNLVSFTKPLPSQSGTLFS